MPGGLLIFGKKKSAINRSCFMLLYVIQISMFFFPSLKIQVVLLLLIISDLNVDTSYPNIIS